MHIIFIQDQIIDPRQNYLALDIDRYGEQAD